MWSPGSDMKRLPLFYAPPERIKDDQASLDKVETQHLSKVLRLKKAALVLVVDGLGMAYRGEIEKIGRFESTVRLHSQIRGFGEPAARVTLAGSLSTGDKFDTIVQKGTELGIKRFVPILSERSQVNFSDPKRIKNRVKRLEKVALASIKQCQRSYRPDIATPISLRDFLKETDSESLNLIFHTAKGAQPFDKLKIPANTKRASLLVGPESGFSDTEAELAVSAGYQIVSLGDRILRTETAGPVVCALVMNALGELR